MNRDSKGRFIGHSKRKFVCKICARNVWDYQERSVCSRRCYYQYRKGKKIYKTSDENNWNWQGSKVGYMALHEWISRKLGKPGICEYCGKFGLSGRQIHWANKSREYKRDLSDWLRLCQSCHAKYDMTPTRLENIRRAQKIRWQN